MTLRRKPGAKLVSVPFNAPQIPLGLNPDLRSERPTTYCLSHGTACLMNKHKYTSYTVYSALRRRCSVHKTDEAVEMFTATSHVVQVLFLSEFGFIILIEAKR
jgi:hypothetical protein